MVVKNPIILALYIPYYRHQQPPSSSKQPPYLLSLFQRMTHQFFYYTHTAQHQFSITIGPLSALGLLLHRCHSIPTEVLPILTPSLPLPSPNISLLTFGLSPINLIISTRPNTKSENQNIMPTFQTHDTAITSQSQRKD